MTIWITSIQEQELTKMPKLEQDNVNVYKKQLADLKVKISNSAPLDALKYVKEAARLNHLVSSGSEINKERKTIEETIAERPDRISTTASDEFQKMRDMAFGGGANPYYEAQRAKAGLDQGFAVDDLSASSLGAQQNAYSQLAQSGGLSSGARERIGADSIASAMKGRQGLRAQGMKNLADIGIAEEGTRAQQQTGVTDALMQETGAQNAYNTDVYNQNNQFRMAQSKSEQERKIAAENKPSCFHPNTLVAMANGCFKPIKLIEVGDETSCGIVYAKSQSIADSSAWMKFKNILLTSNHAVLDEGVWVRAIDSSAVPTSSVSRFTYSIATESHCIECGLNRVMVSDMHETNMGNELGSEESLELKNKVTVEYASVS
jgi:hypothetical protein